MRLIERLLLAGLDHYFEGQIRTSCQYLDPGRVSRARPWTGPRIHRACSWCTRRAAAGDGGVSPSWAGRVSHGDLATARELLTKAVADGGSETALMFLQRLGIAEAGHAAATPIPRGSSDTTASQLLRRHTDRGPGPRATNWTATIGVCLAIAGAIFLAAQPIASWLGERPVIAPLTSPRASDPVPVVRTSELRLARAKTLYDDGKLQDALRALDAIDRGDPLRRDAETLIASIQGALLATVPAASPAEEAAR